MSRKLTPRDILTHPVTAGASVFTTLTLALQIHSLDVLAAFVWANAAQLSTVAGIFGFTILPEVQLGTVVVPVTGWVLDLGMLAGAIKIVAILLFSAYGIKILLRIYNNLQERLTS